MRKPSHPESAAVLIVAAGLLVIVATALPEEEKVAARVESRPRVVQEHAGRGVSVGTRRMIERLQALASSTAPHGAFSSGARLQLLLQSRPGTTPGERMRYRARVAEQLLNTGRTREAANEFRNIVSIYDANRVPVPDAVLVFLGVANLRTQLASNCSSDQARRCSVPITGDVSHPNKRYARNAIEEFTRILKSSTDEVTLLAVKWLLNVSYMSLGEYPGGVPGQWLIPPSALASAYDIKRFPDLAPQHSLNVYGRAGGVVMDDFDADGDLDIMVSSFDLSDQLRLFDNRGDGTFVEVSEEAGLRGIVGGLNLVQADYNNDGYLDVLVLRGGWMNEGHPNSLLRNNGDGTFADVTEESGIFSPAPGQTAAWGDFDNDGWIDLFIGAETKPRSEQVFRCRLFRNDRDGTFTDVSSASGADVVGFVKAAVWGDYDNDNRLDLYVSRLRQPNLLYHNEGPAESGVWTFREVARDAGVQEPIASFPTWFFDYDNDGWLDLFVSGSRGHVSDIAAEYLGTSHRAEVPRLYRNNHDGTFTDVASEVHLDRIMLAMGSNYGDLDNDGYLDFYVGTGDPDMRLLIPNRMFRNAAGKVFQEVTASGGFGSIMKGHAVAFGDLDQDGDQDIYVVLGGAHEGDRAQNALFVNPGHGNSWVTLRFRGRSTNRAAIGARIKVSVATPDGTRDVYATVSSGGSFGASSLQQEIGLGDATSIRSLAVTWPVTGKTDVFDRISLNQTFLIDEGNAAPTPIVTVPFEL